MAPIIRALNLIQRRAEAGMLHTLEIASDSRTCHVGSPKERSCARKLVLSVAPRSANGNGAKGVASVPGTSQELTHTERRRAAAGCSMKQLRKSESDFKKGQCDRNYGPTFVTRLLVFWALAAFAITPARADGCFVFKWDKKTDINEPTQKAIIVHNAGREDMLLQVKYEGPLNEFGWLIPVPSLPTVQKGSMEAFYELSQLTQRRFGVQQSETRGDLAPPNAAGPADPVKVIAIKTVGAYEVAILSAKDSGSLARWLELHGYSLAGGKSAVVDDYIRKGWYFVAAKIQLDQPVDVKIAADSSLKQSKLSSQEQKAVRRKLSSGELQ